MDQYLPIIQMAAEAAADKVLKGEELNEAEQTVVMIGHGLAVTVGEKIAKGTPTPYDDALVESLRKTCYDTAKEGGFPVLVLAMPE